MLTEDRMHSYRWDARHLRSARDIAAERSKDATKVGAVLVSPFGAEILNAYNGPPKGVKDKPERFERPLKYLFAAHAEENLISFAARHGIRTDGCSVYVTHPPCSDCARIMIQAGIRHVVHGAGYFNSSADWEAETSAARTMFAEAGVVCEEVA